MSYKKIAILTMAVLMINLPACTLVEQYEQYVANKQQRWCEQSDWYEVGYRDGGNGKAVSEFTRHASICQKFGITPDRMLWQKGHQTGIDTQYCTEENVRQLARKSYGFNDEYCPYGKQYALKHAYEDEKRRIEIEKLLEEKEKAFKDVENRLQKLNNELSTSSTDNRYAYELKRELEEKRRSLAYDIYYMRDKNGLCQSSSAQSLCRHYDRISRGW